MFNEATTLQQIDANNNKLNVLGIKTATLEKEQRKHDDPEREMEIKQNKLKIEALERKGAALGDMLKAIKQGVADKVQPHVAEKIAGTEARLEAELRQLKLNSLVPSGCSASPAIEASLRSAKAAERKAFSKYCDADSAIDRELGR